MTGKAAIKQFRQRLDATFDRVKTVGAQPELQSDYARYLCVLVSGFLEQALIEVLVEYGRKHSDTRVQSYLEQKVRRVTNIKAQKLIGFLADFDAEWRIDLEGFLVDQYKDAVNSVVDLRNQIAHGHHVALTFSRIQSYYQDVKKVVEHVVAICLPD